MDFQKMMQQAKQMQSDAKRIQRELEQTDIEASASGVNVVVTGAKKLKSIEISPEVVEKNDAKALEKLILKAVNDGLSKADALANKEMKKATGGLGGLL